MFPLMETFFLRIGCFCSSGVELGWVGSSDAEVNKWKCWGRQLKLSEILRKTLFCEVIVLNIIEVQYNLTFSGEFGNWIFMGDLLSFFSV